MKTSTEYFVMGLDHLDGQRERNGGEDGVAFQDYSTGDWYWASRANVAVLGRMLEANPWDAYLRWLPLCPPVLASRPE